jgi:tetratricopeptide (TPR) repeat protein
MLDTVQHYAAERLAASGDEGQVRQRHCVHFVELAERARAALWTPEQAGRFRQLDGERDNVLSAFEATRQAADGDALAFRLIEALRFYLIHRGMPSTVLAMSAGLLARATMTDPLLRCRTLFGAGQAAAFMGRNADARQYLQDSLSIARALGDMARVEQTLQPLGAALMGEGNFAAARACLDEAVALSRQSTNEREHLAALNARGMLHRLEGDLDRAIDTYGAALAIARRIDDRESVAMLLLNLCMAAVLGGSDAGIADMLEEVAGIAEGTGSLAIVQSLIEVCAGRAAMAGQLDRAARLVGFADAQAERTGLRRDAADQAFLERCIGELQARRSEFAPLQQHGAGLALEAALREARASLRGSV